MRRILPAEFDPPVEDGTILSSDLKHLAPFSAQEPPAAIYERIRHVRSLILPRCVEVRNTLNRLLLLNEYGRIHFDAYDLPLRRRLDALLSDNSSIDDKIERARPILRHLMHRDAEMLFYRLFEVGRLFRVMATRPLFIVELYMASTTRPRREDDYELCIADGQFLWSIDRQQLFEWHTLLNRCNLDLQKAIDLLAPVTARAATG